MYLLNEVPLGTKHLLAGGVPIAYNAHFMLLSTKLLCPKALKNTTKKSPKINSANGLYLLPNYNQSCHR